MKYACMNRSFGKWNAAWFSFSVGAKCLTMRSIRLLPTAREGAVLILALVLGGILGSPGRSLAADERVVDIGTRLELMIDDYLIAKTSGQVRHVLHHPVAREVVMRHDMPWEGSGCGYHSIFRDGDRYRMYYKAWQLTVADGRVEQPHPLFACYAESRDGVHWEKPSLGLVDFQGSKDNNIFLAPGKLGDVVVDPGHVAVFKDLNPNCPAESRYKAVVRCENPRGLLAYGSPDGIRFHPLSTKPVVTGSLFDSQNLAFWDPHRRQYRMYYRDFRDGRRDIRTCTSDDFLHWSTAEWLEYPGAANEHLYTNQIKPYERAPHLLIGFPTRYVERGWSRSMRQLPELAHREARAAASGRYGWALTEGLLMSSRDGRVFHRWAEAFLRPGPQRNGSWAYGDHYFAWHAVQTPAAEPGADPELSLYATEGYWTGTSDRLRRYTLRLDGFASFEATMRGGEITTVPVRFSGNRLVINFSTSAAGSIRVELQDASGRPLDGYTLNDCPPIFGDQVERVVAWKSGADVGQLAGQPGRLRLVLKDANLYALRFRAHAESQPQPAGS